MTSGLQAYRDIELHLPVRIRIAVPPEGLGSQLDQMVAWLDANCGPGSWLMTPSGACGVVNDAGCHLLSQYRFCACFRQSMVHWFSKSVRSGSSAAASLAV
jgi:hypothetical protein